MVDALGRRSFEQTYFVWERKDASWYISNVGHRETLLMCKIEKERYLHDALIDERINGSRDAASCDVAFLSRYR